MGNYQDALSNIMPIDWMDPYGRTPFAKDAELSVDITIVETDDGIRAKSVKNPPSSGSSRLMDAIKNALGVGFIDCMDPCSSSQADDLGKQDGKDSGDKSHKPQNKSEKSQDSDTMNSGNHRFAAKDASRDRNPGDGGSEDSGEEVRPSDDTKEKAPKFK